MPATALPDATVATNSAATQSDVKNWLTSLHDYLAGLLGTDGTTATAIATLGVVSGVSSFNGRSGAVTPTSGDVTGALGYTPVRQDNGSLAVGSICVASPFGTSGSLEDGSAIAGSSLMTYTATSGPGWTAGPSPSGTWRNVSGSLLHYSIGGGSIGLFQRIA